MKNRLLLLLSTILFFSTPCHGQTIPTVFVSIPPQKFFIDSIAGGNVQVQIMVNPGANPITYEPKPSQMIALSRSIAYFSIGVPFEQAWLDRIRGVNSHMNLIPTDKGIKKRKMTAQHGADGPGTDPHIWLSPRLVKVQALTIKDALIKLIPEKQSVFEKNYRTFLLQIDQLEQEIGASLLGQADKKFLVFHPSWGYFARDFGLTQVAIEIEGKEPKPAQLTAIIKECQQAGIRIIFAQPQFSQRSARTIAKAIRGQVILIDPLGENWLQNMRDVANKLQELTE
ncbi:metal ABC transporter solute-binding protein, Zn/Mn family [Desulfotalea psychrophila]|uniref:Related to Mn/Zn ABC transporter, periplasmic solute binding protein n=1 Tax=Desulfotalea psychrophila (strain LSv54 / DSM 12343) TaxID=177439 RepID=Q6AIP1_DESPS|nr:zinc ABC transporter substrate-binding protein [Desulfotalea psychrophila]CAG37789.1 related to Mn/Zn ABC transporter, periplasmic solute binding protein [Desulfotalea psychrophila LSv54]